MLKDIIRSFLPWILFFILLNHSQEQIDIAVIIAGVTSVIFDFRGLKKRFILNWGTFAFFIFLFVAVVLFKNQWVAKQAWLFSNGTLAAIAWISILLRQPFTIQYAKLQVAKDKWNHPLFLKINYILTAVWGSIFLFNLMIHVLRIYYHTVNGWIYESITYGTPIFGIWFMAWFPNWYRKKILVQAHEKYSRLSFFKDYHQVKKKSKICLQLMTYSAKYGW
ncbi:MAG TPA: hypothetical protein VG895_05730 [Patescibacteria group bacterium]|nr:hypothetical protein [Gammaproteobacteria bacterium]HWA52514.1 hypothetical protein [Patescibacteria group bacterium]